MYAQFIFNYEFESKCLLEEDTYLI